jgi:hypothetical protein
MLPKEKQNRHTNGIISRLGSLGAKSVARTVPQDNVASGVGAKCAYQNIIHTKERIHQYNLIQPLRPNEMRVATENERNEPSIPQHSPLSIASFLTQMRQNVAVTSSGLAAAKCETLSIRNALLSWRKYATLDGIRLSKRKSC